MSTRPAAARLRSQLLAKPGFTRLPVCPHCGQEIPLLSYAAHTRDCEKASQPPPPAAQAPASETNGSARTSQKGLVYGLFDAKAVARLERAGAELAQLRHQLRAEHGSTSSAERVERCREIARSESQVMALIVEQLRQRFRMWGSGMIFLRNLRPHVVDGHLRDACAELIRMADPEVWRIA